MDYGCGDDVFPEGKAMLGTGSHTLTVRIAVSHVVDAVAALTCVKYRISEKTSYEGKRNRHCDYPKQRLGNGLNLHSDGWRRVARYLTLRCGLRRSLKASSPARHIELQNRWLQLNGAGEF